ncbi:hypothetical protein LQ327_05185 [Actinomycetospora endophytica]|uniref:Integral membrane protein n=1 Tax=Actinomycetospora endophytica TaxID=2291215 RepID=A0ABS8P3E9_9PSEU|nr:hypothetical protein [Actinomycetospora endophytica]MCD2192780.1 hypothetical protein [Actinomycetospora endophytica]
MAHTTGAMPAVRTSDPLLTTLRVFAALTVLNLLVQFLTAGELVTRGGNEAVEPIHAGGAIVLHVLSGLAALAALAYWRLRGAPLWPGVVAAVVFVLTFVQAWYGSGRTLYIHVPGAMILTIGAVVVAVWAFLPTARNR